MKAFNMNFRGMVQFSTTAAAVAMITHVVISTAFAQSPIPKVVNYPCPVNYRSSGDSCVPGKDAMPAFLKGKSACPVGTQSNGPYCVENRKSSSSSDSGSSANTGPRVVASQLGGSAPTRSYGSPVVASFAKKNMADYCPSTYFTHQEFCVATERTVSTTNPPPAAVRFKESESCNADETEEYGIYCVGPLADEWRYSLARSIFMRGYNDHYQLLSTHRETQAVAQMNKTGPVEPASLAALKAKENAAKGIAAPTAAAPANAGAASPNPDESVVKSLGGALKGLFGR